MTGRLPMLAVTIGVAAALIATIVLEPIPLYIWNASASVPIGLYRLRPADQFQVTELVAVQPPEPLATFLDLNGYLPIGVPHDFGRRGRGGRGEGPRRTRPAAAEMAGLPRRRRRRSVSDELAVGRLS